MERVLARLDWPLRALGAATLGALLLVVKRLLRVKAASCDYACACAKLPPNAYAGKVVWVTGASSGIGRGLAVLLAKQGARLILSARREQVLQEVLQEIRPLLAASGGDARVVVADLSDLPSLPAKAAEALTLYGGGIDVLVNNAGFSSRALARDNQTVDLESDMMKVNFLSWVLLTKCVLPSMIQHKRGHIINISSLAGKFGSPLRTLYCGAKHAVLGWFDALRAEEAALDSNIRVTNICPGSVKTDVARNAVQADGQKRGVSDPNIENGLEVGYVAERILASAHCGLDEVWIAKWSPELQATYLSQYFPATFKKTIRGAALAQIVRIMGEDFLKSKKLA